VRRWLILLAVFAVVVLAHPLWLGAAGAFLVSQEPPVQSDALVVLAGDQAGLRIQKGGELVRQGFAPKALVSSPGTIYGVGEAELSIADAARHGFPSELFEAVDVPADSTEEEASRIIPMLRARGVRSVLVVTSDFHTARAGRIWRRLAQGITVRMVAAPDKYFRADSWWKSRPGRKTAFLEWVKTITGPLGA
jgi:uncharacterized SAM-binding protein YcdF (DUF218 family)